MPEFAPKPLFRDPLWDGAADPTVIFHREKKTWWLVYTNRRASVEGLPGVSWVHGTHLGLAESRDGGLHWHYRGVLKLPLGTADDSHWAPELLWHEGLYHMFLTFVPGMHTDWSGTRELHHLTSPDLVHWERRSQLALASDRVIDACVRRLADGTWRLWYNNERDRKAIYFADSPDLFTWKDKGKATGELPGEGPYVFFWHGKYWMVVDIWRGLAVYHSSNALNWTRQERLLLDTPGTGTDDQVMGGHAMVQVCGERAYLFYFTHPGRTPENKGKDNGHTRRSSIQVTELRYENDGLTCHRDQPVAIQLTP